MNLWTFNITLIFLFSFVLIAFSQDKEENESGESIVLVRRNMEFPFF